MKNKKLTILSLLLNLVLLILIGLLSIKCDVFTRIQNKLTPVEITYNPYVHPLYANTAKIHKSLNISGGGICFAGDSITYYSMFDEWFPDLIVTNRGIGSDTTRGLLARIDTIIATQAKKLFIMIGINDLGDNLSTEETLDNYNQIITRIQTESPNTQIYIQSILPCNAIIMPKNERNARRTPHRIQSLNNEIKQLVATHGVPYIDLYNQFVDDKGNMNSKYTYDGVHLSAQGFIRWKESIDTIVLED